MSREAADVRLVNVGAGAIALTHRPKVKALQAMAWAEDLAAAARSRLELVSWPADGTAGSPPSPGRLAGQ